MAEQPFPLPLTDGDGIGFLGLFLENRCNGSNNPQTKSQVSRPVSAPAPVRQTPPEGRSRASVLPRPVCCPQHLAHFPYWSGHSFMLSYPSNSPGQPISQSSFMAVVGTALHPCQHPPTPGCQLLPHLKGFSLFCCVEASKTKTREGTVPTWHRRGHMQRKVTFFFSFTIKVGVTVNSNRRNFRQKLDLLKFTNISMCVLSHTLMAHPSCNLTILLIFAVLAR